MLSSFRYNEPIDPKFVQSRLNDFETLAQTPSAERGEYDAMEPLVWSQTALTASYCNNVPGLLEAIDDTDTYPGLAKLVSYSSSHHPDSLAQAVYDAELVETRAAAITDFLRAVVSTEVDSPYVIRHSDDQYGTIREEAGRATSRPLTLNVDGRRELSVSTPFVRPNHALFPDGNISLFDIAHRRGGKIYQRDIAAGERVVRQTIAKRFDSALYQPSADMYAPTILSALKLARDARLMLPDFLPEQTVVDLEVKLYPAFADAAHDKLEDVAEGLLQVRPTETDDVLKATRSFLLDSLVDIDASSPHSIGRHIELAVEKVGLLSRLAIIEAGQTVHDVIHTTPSAAEHFATTKEVYTHASLRTE